MRLSGSLIILFSAIGAVISLFAGDYYFRYLDKRSERLVQLEVQNNAGDQLRTETWTEEDMDLAA